jgi:hypothetical protein
MLRETIASVRVDLSEGHARRARTSSLILTVVSRKLLGISLASCLIAFSASLPMAVTVVAKYFKPADTATYPQLTPITHSLRTNLVLANIMSSLTRVRSSKSNGALSKGTATSAGKQRSSQNSMRHGLCAECIAVEVEARDNFLIRLQHHVDRFRPAGEVEFGLIEEMCASYWSQRRLALSASHSLALWQRYETRLHPTYQRAQTKICQTNLVPFPNTRDSAVWAPPQPQQSTDSEALVGPVGQASWPVRVNRPDLQTRYHLQMQVVGGAYASYS